MISPSLPTNTSPTRRAFLQGSLLTLPAALAGCEAAALVAQVLPQPKIPAAYVPINRPTVVFIDDPSNILPSGQFLGVIASRVSHDLKENEAISYPVDVQAVERLRFSDDQFAQYSIARIGREVGAEQIIYVRIDGYTLSDNSQMYKPSLWGRIKLVDVASSKRLFPLDSPSGVTLTTELSYKRITPDTRNESTAIGRIIADKFGQDIAKLFYPHHDHIVGSGLDDYKD